MRQTTSDACQSPGRGSGMRATCKSPWPWPGVDFRSSSPPPTLGSGIISLTQPSPQGRKTQLPCPSPTHPRGWACPCPTLSLAHRAGCKLRLDGTGWRAPGSRVDTGAHGLSHVYPGSEPAHCREPAPGFVAWGYGCRCPSGAWEDSVAGGPGRGGGAEGAAQSWTKRALGHWGAEPRGQCLRPTPGE